MTARAEDFLRNWPGVIMPACRCSHRDKEKSETHTENLLDWARSLPNGEGVRYDPKRKVDTFAYEESEDEETTGTNRKVNNEGVKKPLALGDIPERPLAMANGRFAIENGAMSARAPASSSRGMKKDKKRKKDKVSEVSDLEDGHTEADGSGQARDKTKKSKKADAAVEGDADGHARRGKKRTLKKKVTDATGEDDGDDIAGADDHVKCGKKKTLKKAPTDTPASSLNATRSTRWC